MKYKVGDKVKIKSLDWHNKHISGTEVTCGEVPFTSDMKKFCSRVMTISFVHADCYTMVEDLENYYTDEMIECKVEDETKPKFKIGDIIVKAHLRFRIVKVECDRYIVEERPGINLVVLFKDQDEYRLVAEKTKPKPKFYIGDRVKWYNRTCYIIDIYTDEDIYTYLIKHDDYREGESFEKWVPEIELTFEDNEETPIKIEGKVITNNDMIVSIDEYILPNGYIFKDENGNVINATKIVLEKKKKEYPKTYKECCETMQVARPIIWFNYNDVRSISKEGDEYESHIENTLCTFRKLLICRDAYWKIAGEEMGLGKPWEPDWKNDEQGRYMIMVYENKLHKDRSIVGTNFILVFPTEEMRDAFKENFKELIEKCKELL